MPPLPQQYVQNIFLLLVFVFCTVHKAYIQKVERVVSHFVQCRINAEPENQGIKAEILKRFKESNTSPLICFFLREVNSIFTWVLTLVFFNITEKQTKQNTVPASALTLKGDRPPSVLNRAPAQTTDKYFLVSPDMRTELFSRINMSSYKKPSTKRIYSWAWPYIPRERENSDSAFRFPFEGQFWTDWQPTLIFLPGKILWTEDPGRLQSMGSQRVRHDWATSLYFTSVNLLGLASNQPDNPYRSPKPKETQSGHNCFSVVKWLNFPFKGKTTQISSPSPNHQHHHFCFFCIVNSFT